ncbi:DUF397 domain-containing protein [Streptomyces bobili]|jgi:hypothetical protein|uniref:DUF397 domain-containing protein n=1 Tax=Streptomyces bobili TaxID=67280 RepID=UPI00382150D0
MTVKTPAGDGSELSWIKSSHSNPDGAACVEVALTSVSIHIRDSKNHRSPHLAFAPSEWAAFVSYAADH